MENNWNLIPEELRGHLLDVVANSLWEEYSESISNPSDPMGRTAWELVQITREFLGLPVPPFELAG